VCLLECRMDPIMLHIEVDWRYHDPLQHNGSLAHIARPHPPGIPPPAGEGLRGLAVIADTLVCWALCQRPIDRTSAARSCPIGAAP
jgi:hypothetical protein